MIRYVHVLLMFVIHTRGISKWQDACFKKQKIDNMTTYPNYNHPFECCSLRCPQCTIQYQNQNMTCAKQPSICLRLPLSLAVSLVHVPNFLLLKILTYQDLPVLPLPIFWFFLCLILSLFPCSLICSYIL